MLQAWKTIYRSPWSVDSRRPGLPTFYSISSRSSFLHIKQLHQQILDIKVLSATSSSHSSPWTIAKASNFPQPVILVGNKIDCRAEWEVSMQEGCSLARELSMEFFEISAKEDTEVNGPFFELVRMVRRQREQAFTQPIAQLATRSGHSTLISSDIAPKSKEKSDRRCLFCCGRCQH